jgi:hypothetical protein
MCSEEKMTIDEQRKYLGAMKRRYVRADRKTKTQLLNEMEAVTGKHRKSLIRLLHGSLERRPREKQRERSYGADVDYALQIIYESFDYICAERLTPNLVRMAKQLDAHGELMTTPELLEQLAQISISSVQRRLRGMRRDRPRLPRRRPRGNPLTRDIPMLRLPWDIAQPGHFEADLVHHCGESSSGEYVCTLQIIDVATGWSERRAVLGRSQRVMAHAFRRILAHLPFPILQIHPDNGGEFFSNHLLRLWGDVVQGVQLSRSRPFHKNDNPRVEQKNATLVRAYLGDRRLDSVSHTIALNVLYDQMWAFYNLFQPVMHLTEKQVIQEPGKPVRVRRKHDQPVTPFERLCRTSAILPEHKELLEALRDSINPRRLRQDICDAIDALFKLPGAAPGVTEDVHLTLLDVEDRWLDLLFNRTPMRDDHEPACGQCGQPQTPGLPTLPTAPTTAAVTFPHTDERRGTFW